MTNGAQRQKLKFVCLWFASTPPPGYLNIVNWMDGRTVACAGWAASLSQSRANKWRLNEGEASAGQTLHKRGRLLPRRNLQKPRRGDLVPADQCGSLIPPRSLERPPLLLACFFAPVVASAVPRRVNSPSELLGFPASCPYPQLFGLAITPPSCPLSQTSRAHSRTHTHSLCCSVVMCGLAACA